MKSHKFSLRKISTRIMLIFLGITTVIFSIFTVVITSLFSDKLTEEINLVSSQQLEFAETLLNDRIKEIRNYHFSIQNKPQIQTYMSEFIKSNNTQTSDELYHTLKETIGNTDRNHLNIRSTFILSKEKEILDPLFCLEQYKWLIEDNPEFSKFLSSQLTLRISAPNSFPFQEETQNTLTCFCRLYSEDNYEELGYIVINMNRNSFFKEIAEFFQDTWAQFYIVDENQNIIYSNPLDAKISQELNALLAENYPKLGKQVSIENNTYMGYSKKVSDYPNWKIVGFIDYDDIYKSLHNILQTLVFVYFVLIFFACLIHYYLAQHITVPIRTLNTAMRTIRKGNWPTPIPITRDDEMSEVLNGFNKMNFALQEITAQVAAQQEETRKKEVALIQSQLDLLESQINPHFIHNTLNTMKYLAKIAKAERLENLIISFNALLRTSMSTERLLIPLSEEAENLYHYMDIQKERYDFPIDFQCDIPENASSVLLPKLILQPLVENSLFHGLAPNDGGIIRVKARLGENRLWVIVWDNGVGISKEQLPELEERLRPSARGYSRIGIANVNTRLILSYGASSHLVIESSPEEGTSFSFSIPV